jgi:hypothetical protein
MEFYCTVLVTFIDILELHVLIGVWCCSVLGCGVVLYWGVVLFFISLTTLPVLINENNFLYFHLEYTMCLNSCEGA